MDHRKSEPWARVGKSIFSALRSALIGSLIAGLCGCHLFAYTNVRRECDPGDPVSQPNCKTSIAAQAAAATPGYHGRATFDVKPDRGDPNTLFVLAFSGGGSRAAYFSTDVMIALQSVFAPDLNLLSEVDAISSVSGGSMAAAYYVMSSDAPGAGNSWSGDKARRLMRKNYTLKWLGNWFWPYNIAKFWFTSYNRTDIMARTLSKNLYSTAILRDLRMRDLASDRPYLILNATNGTEGQFDRPFTFTDEDFSEIGSDIQAYSLGRAVMGTAAFPAVFNYMTLRNWSSTEKEPQYIHVFDGGNYDNLGLRSVIRVLDRMKASRTPYQNLVVILVDAYTDPRGVAANLANPRGFTDYIIDKNFLASSDALLHLNRDNILGDFNRALEKWYEADPSLKKHAVFYHLQLQDVGNFGDTDDRELAHRLNRIPTNFKIEKDDADDIDTAIGKLLSPDNYCLQAIKQLVRPIKPPGEHDLPDPVCRYPADVPAKGTAPDKRGVSHGN